MIAAKLYLNKSLLYNKLLLTFILINNLFSINILEHNNSDLLIIEDPQFNYYIETELDKNKDLVKPISFVKRYKNTSLIKSDRDCDSGYVQDCSDSDCCPESWVGDGYADCEDQLYGCDLSCYDNDGGDCESNDSDCVSTFQVDGYDPSFYYGTC